MAISIVIPAYNEEHRIGSSIKKIKAHLPDSEITVVDDGSTDSTKKICQKLHVKVISSDRNKGKGHAVRTGLCDATNNLILVTDSDLATPISEVDRFLKMIGDYDIVIASRNLKDSVIEVKQPLFRQGLGKILPFFVRFLTPLKFRDTQCGFKLFTKKAAKEICKRATIDGFAFDVEFLVIAKTQGLKVMEMPVHWIDKEESKVKVFHHSFQILRDLCRIRLNLLRGKYR